MAYREGAAGLLSENQRIRGLISSVIDIMLLIAAYLLANFLRLTGCLFLRRAARPGTGYCPQPYGCPGVGGLRRGDGAALLEPRAV